MIEARLPAGITLTVTSQEIAAARGTRHTARPSHPRSLAKGKPSGKAEASRPEAEGEASEGGAEKSLAYRAWWGGSRPTRNRNHPRNRRPPNAPGVPQRASGSLIKLAGSGAEPQKPTGTEAPNATNLRTTNRNPPTQTGGTTYGPHAPKESTHLSTDAKPRQH
ncbi:hypothetical protein GCM10027200_22130 [Lentzea nigeriaca]